MKYDAVSYVPERPFRSETGASEFESDAYCLNLNGPITLHLKTEYLNDLLGMTPPDERQIRRWHFYIAHLNCVYLLLDSLVLQSLQIAYFDIEEISTKNVNVVSESGISIGPRSHRSFVSSLPGKPFTLSSDILRSVNNAFLAATSKFERVVVLSEIAKSLAAYKQADFTTSLVLSWFLLERFVESIWTHYLESENRDFDNGQKRINAKRRKLLNDSRAYPISVKLQILELARTISFEQFSELDFLRGKRNEIVHPNVAGGDGTTVEGDPGSCRRAFNLLQQFLNSEFDLRLTLNMSYSYMEVFDR